MRNITFIGSLDSTFASRWRRELDPEGVARGKSLKKFLGKGQRLDDATLEKVNRRLMGSQIDAKAVRLGLELELEKRGTTRSFNGKRSDAQSNGLVAPKDRDYRRKSLSLNREIRMNEAKITASKKRVTAFENQPKKPKIDFDKPNVIFETKPPTKSTHVMPTNKVKLGIKGKLGLGAVGLVTAGAIGYGLTRKIRSDKNKKRGSYRR